MQSIYQLIPCIHKLEFRCTHSSTTTYLLLPGTFFQNLTHCNLPKLSSCLVVYTVSVQRLNLQRFRGQVILGFKNILILFVWNCFEDNSCLIIVCQKCSQLFFKYTRARGRYILIFLLSFIYAYILNKYKLLGKKQWKLELQSHHFKELLIYTSMSCIHY